MEKSLNCDWEAYPELDDKASTILMLFTIMPLCEQKFSILVLMKIK